mgnify:CR=1 FL=1
MKNVQVLITHNGKMPPTLIASIYGMNFSHMPGLENEYGYYISLVVMLVSIILPLVYFRSRRLL